MDRAHEHLDDLDGEARACIERYRNGIARSIDAQRGLYLYNFGQLNPPDYRLGVLIGEVAHALRAALNHIAYALAPTVEYIQFPIFDEGAKCSEALRDFPPESRKELRRWQPYNAGKHAHDHPLWIVHRLDIVEKHQCVPTFPVSVSMGRPALRGHNQDGDAILAVPAIAGMPEPDLYPDLALHVSLDPFPKATKLVPLTSLRDAYDLVRTKVIPSVEKVMP